LPTEFLVQEIPGESSVPVPRLVFVGDSLVGGLAASDPKERVPFKVAQMLPPHPGVTAFSLSGRSSSYISDKFRSVPNIPADAILVVWVGRNNVAQGEIVLRDIKAMIKHAKVRRFLVLSIPPANDLEEHPGSSRRDAVDSLNSKLAEAFGEKFVRVGTGTKCSDRADNVHFTAAGQAKIAAEVAGSLSRFGWLRVSK
jgi:hypothetical protein